MPLSPLMRIGFFAVLFVSIAEGMVGALALCGYSEKTASPILVALDLLAIELIPALLAYLLLVRLIEQRDVAELSLRALPRLGGAGCIAGSVLFSAVVGALWLVGCYQVVATNAHPNWVPEFLAAGLCAGMAEEVVFRGLLFRIVEERMGTWIALLVSAALFAAFHADNPGATMWNMAALAIEGGVPLGLLYHVTRSLWPCAGAHAAWNLTQGVVFGIPVSGMRGEGILVSRLTGPGWLSGGVFGVEASVVSLTLCSVCTSVLLAIASRRRSIVLPFWMRQDESASAGGIGASIPRRHRSIVSPGKSEK